MSFPDVLDSSIMNDFRKCPRSFYEGRVENLGLEGTSVHLHFGGCFATGLEVARKAFYINGESPERAAELGINAALIQWGDWPEQTEGRKQAKCWGGLVELLLGYFQQWPLSTDSLRPAFGGAIEFSFAHPLIGLKHPITGGDIIYAGRFDMLGQIDDILIVNDEKTTGRTLNGDWSKGWSIRSQFIGYVWACQQLGYNVQSVLVRGCSIQAKGVSFAQSFVPVPSHLIDRWYTQLQRDVARMLECHATGYWDYNLGDACKNPLSGQSCQFQALCEAKNREDWTTLYKVQQPWSPLRPAGEE